MHPLTGNGPEAWRLAADEVVKNAVMQAPGPSGAPEAEALVIGRRRAFIEACVSEEELLPTGTRAWKTACELLVRHGAYLRTAENHKSSKRYVFWGALTTGFMALEPPAMPGTEFVVPALKISTDTFGDPKFPFSEDTRRRAQQSEPRRLFGAVSATRQRDKAYGQVLDALHTMPSLKLEVGVAATKAALLSDNPKAHWELVYPRTKNEARKLNSHSNIPALKYISNLMGTEPDAAFWLQPIKAFKPEWYDDEPTASWLTLKRPTLPAMPYINPGLTREEHMQALNDDIAQVKEEWKPVGIADSMLSAAALTDTPLRDIVGFRRPLDDWRWG